MQDLDWSMRYSVNEQILFCLDAFESMPRRTWLATFPSQAVLVAQKLLWSRMVQQVSGFASVRS